MSVKVTGLFDLGNDVLLVKGTRTTEQDGNTVEIPVEATGWVSALSQHYPDNAYDGDGSLKLKPHKGTLPKGAETRGHGDPVHTPRSMTSAEKQAYAERLLREQLPPEPREL